MRNSYIILMALAAITLAGCQEEIDLDLPATEPELVIEGYLTQRDYYFPNGDLDCFGTTVPLADIVLATQLVDAFINIDSIESEADYFPFNKVQLTLTGDYFANEIPQTVSNASVMLYEDGNVVETLIEDPNIPGTYRITHYPKIGSEYHLWIQALGNIYETERELYESVPPLIGLTANYGPNFIQDSCAYYVNIDTYEKPGAGDHYRWFFYLNNEYDKRPGFISITNDDNFDGFCLFGFDVYGDELELGDTLTAFQMNATEGYFNFLSSLQSQTAFVGGPFDSPPAPIRGNLNNLTTGKPAFGYFAAGGISANATAIPDTIPDVDCP
ncbi:DUF4249 domain-containing protein [Salibacteraceae bacterium]|nr:DUF4249 domain-containing protein [Salibacteraceae bacterium]MDC1202441.1 DUF4249 domain-containing protein [Salibacteraceae bacterium]HAW19521.1 hypothetical protein [Flavobacteriales bacterium]